MKPNALWLLVACAASLCASAAGGAVGGGLPRCHSNQLRLAKGTYGEAALQFRQTLTLRNVSSRACELGGWPNVRVKDERLRVVAVRTVRVVQGSPNAPPFRVVTLRPGGAASFNVYGPDWNAAANRECRKTSAILVRPPGARATLDVRVRIPSCGPFYIAPLIAGRRDRNSWSFVWKP
jgi:Protein of unknown function (DUF4232)